VTDFLLGYLNYQIEHHLFPTLPPSSLERLQPKVRAVCESYGVPYVQESLGKRVKKLVDIMVGKTRMPRTDTKRAGTAHASGSIAPEIAPV
jgi:fatty acid desaturase